jgi:hypothetical protein
MLSIPPHESTAQLKNKIEARNCLKKKKKREIMKKGGRGMIDHLGINSLRMKTFD